MGYAPLVGVDEESKATRRGVPRGVYVLVVHDPAVAVDAVCETLAALFIVREATTAFDALERLSGAPLACVVCVVGGSIHGADFLEMVARATPDQARRVVVVGDREGLCSDDAAWLPKTASPREVLAVVNALSGRR